MNDQVATFFNTYPARTLAASDILLTPDDEPEGVYFIADGTIRQYDIAPNGNMVVVNVFRKGAHFPMSHAINQTTNEWYFDAVTDVTLHVAPSSQFVAFLKENPEALYEFAVRLCSGASGQQRRMAHLMGGSAQTRTLFELITEAKRFGTPNGPTITLTTTDSEIAAKAGLSREAINRVLSSLASDGIIQHEYGKIVVLSLADLEAKLGSGI